MQQRPAIGLAGNAVGILELNQLHHPPPLRGIGISPPHRGAGHLQAVGESRELGATPQLPANPQHIVPPIGFEGEAMVVIVHAQEQASVLLRGQNFQPEDIAGEELPGVQIGHAEAEVAELGRSEGHSDGPWNGESAGWSAERERKRRTWGSSSGAVKASPTRPDGRAARRAGAASGGAPAAPALPPPARLA